MTAPQRLVLRRLARDRLAVAAGILVSIMLLLVYAGPNVIGHFLGHGPNDPLPYAVDESLKPVGPWTRVPATSNSIPGVSYDKFPEGTKTTLLILGGDGPLGRDELLRLFVGGRVSLEVAVGAAVLAILLGIFAGAVAGFYGGWIDGIISRFADLVMAFPLLLLLVVVGSTVAPRFIDITFGFLEPGVVALVVTIALFTWFYPARIVRGEIHALKEREFVESARMIGSGEWRILRVHLLPHVIPVVLAYSAFLVATNVLLEAGVTFLGVGVRLPTASWGNLLSTAWGNARIPSPFDTDQSKVWLTVFPSIMIFLTAVSWTMLGEGLRRALEPRR